MEKSVNLKCVGNVEGSLSALSWCARNIAKCRRVVFCTLDLVRCEETLLMLSLKFRYMCSKCRSNGLLQPIPSCVWQVWFRVSSWELYSLTEWLSYVKPSREYLVFSACLKMKRGSFTVICSQSLSWSASSMPYVNRPIPRALDIYLLTSPLSHTAYIRAICVGTRSCDQQPCTAHLLCGLPGWLL